MTSFGALQPLQLCERQGFAVLHADSFTADVLANTQDLVSVQL